MMVFARTRLPGAFILLTASLLLTACGGSDNKPQPSPTPSPTPTPDPVFSIDAGEDQSVSEKSKITLQGNAFDPEDSITGVQWTQTSGPLVTISESHSLSPTFTTPALSEPAVAIFSMSVSNATETLTDSVAIVIHPKFEVVPVFPPMQAAYTGPTLDVSGSVDNYASDLEAVSVSVSSGSNTYYADIDEDGQWRIENLTVESEDGLAFIAVTAMDGQSQESEYFIRLQTNPNIADADDLIFDSNRERFYVYSQRDKQIVAIDNQGNRQILLANAPFSGDALDCTVYNDKENTLNDAIYCSEPQRIVTINPTTGQVTVVAEGFNSIDQIVAAPEHQAIYITEPGVIYKLDTLTHQYEIISDDITGSGPSFMFAFFVDLMFDADDNRLLAHDGYTLYSFDLSSLERAIPIEYFSDIEFAEAKPLDPEDPFSLPFFDITEMTLDGDSNLIYFYNKDDDSFYNYNLNLAQGTRLSVTTELGPYENTGTMGFYLDTQANRMYILKDIYDYIAVYDFEDNNSQFFSSTTIGNEQTKNYGFEQLDLNLATSSLYALYAREEFGQDAEAAIPFLQLSELSVESSERKELAYLQRETFTFGEFKVARADAKLYYLFEGELFEHNLRTAQTSLLSHSGQGYAEAFNFNGGELFIDTENQLAIYCQQSPNNPAEYSDVFTIDLLTGERKKVQLKSSSGETISIRMQLASFDPQSHTMIVASSNFGYEYFKINTVSWEAQALPFIDLLAVPTAMTYDHTSNSLLLAYSGDLISPWSVTQVNIDNNMAATVISDETKGFGARFTSALDILYDEKYQRIYIADAENKIFLIDAVTGNRITIAQ
ncbi:hypothetical protein TDB9533_01024 [Thalassocella blandensis]|nr:hypothetical protein TDB9533_01024 [Thalassocella blandensis]